MFTSRKNENYQIECIMAKKGRDVKKGASCLIRALNLNQA